MATPSRGRSRRLATAERVDPAAQGGVGRQGEVEPLADPVRVQADERPSPSTSAPPDEPGASGAVCSTLPAIRRPPGPRNARRHAETRPNVTRDAAADGGRGAEDGRAHVERVAGAPGDRRGAGRVDRDDREVAVGVDAGDGAARGSPVGEGDRDLVAAQVVGVGQDLAVGDDDAGATAVSADADDRTARPRWRPR